MEALARPMIEITTSDGDIQSLAYGPTAEQVNSLLRWSHGPGVLKDFEGCFVLDSDVKLEVGKYTYDLPPIDTRPGFASLPRVWFLSTRQWVSQSLGVWRFEFGKPNDSSPPSPAKRATREKFLKWPKNVVYWKGLRDEVRKFVEKLPENDFIHSGRRSILHRGDNELTASALFKSLLENLIRVLYPQGTVTLWPQRHFSEEQSSDPPSSDQPSSDESSKSSFFDITVKSEKVILVAEMQRTATFRNSLYDATPDLAILLAQAELLDKESGSWIQIIHEQKAFIRRLSKAFSQLFSYMVTQNVGYGVLSSADLTYFVKRTADGMVLVSDPFEWINPHLVRTLGFVLNAAEKDVTVYLNQDYRYLRTINQSSRKDPPSQDPSKGEGCSKGTGLSRFSFFSDPHGGVHRQLRNEDHCMDDQCISGIALEELHLHESPLARGWTGKIFEGHYNNSRIVVKLAPLQSEQGKAIFSEAHVYLKLVNLWGKYVPRLVIWGTIKARRCIFIATEFIPGSDLQNASITHKVVNEAMCALQAVHEHEVLHCDIRANNLRVRHDGSVALLDFGFSCTASSSTETDEECLELWEILTNLWSKDSRRLHGPVEVNQQIRVF